MVREIRPGTVKFGPGTVKFGPGTVKKARNREIALWPRSPQTTPVKWRVDCLVVFPTLAKKSFVYHVSMVRARGTPFSIRYSGLLSSQDLYRVQVLMGKRGSEAAAAKFVGQDKDAAREYLAKMKAKPQPKMSTPAKPKKSQVSEVEGPSSEPPNPATPSAPANPTTPARPNPSTPSAPPNAATPATAMTTKSRPG